jgi:hypothetical protein
MWVSKLQNEKKNCTKKNFVTIKYFLELGCYSQLHGKSMQQEPHVQQEHMVRYHGYYGV